MKKIFIDGSEGTTGLRIAERLAQRQDITLLEIDPSLRKDEPTRKQLLNQADIAFLCLPDAAARQAVQLVDNPNTVIIDASTAHRTAEGWVYGFAELAGGHKETIAKAKRITNPGCHAVGYIALTRPLVSLGLLDKSYPITCYSITGYSGGGKGMIAQYQQDTPMRDKCYAVPRQYALGLEHKHLPEMQKYSTMHHPPVFSPIVGDFYAGMAVSVPLHLAALKGNLRVGDIFRALQGYYKGNPLIQVSLPEDTPQIKEGFLNPGIMAQWDTMQILVTGSATQVQLIALFDNLGKGASGAAVQCMNLVLGVAETTGLAL